MTDDKSEFAGMTVNERLFAAGLLPQWDDACRKRDRQKMIAVLSRVVTEDQAVQTTDSVLAHPEVYLRHLGPAT